MKRLTAFILLLILAVTLCACDTTSSKTEVISSLDGVYAIDLKQYAKDSGLDYSDIAGCSSEWTFTPDGKLSVSQTTVSTAAEASEALRQPVTTTTETTYSISENIECTLPATYTYTLDGETMLWENGIVMGTVKSSKTSKGVTTIKLDTPNGGNKTLKGTLDESKTVFTIDAAENKMSASYAIREDNTLQADKGVVLGTITERSTENGVLTLKVTAPDGTSVSYTGHYQPDFKIGSVKYTFTYSNGVLTLSSSKQKLTLVKQ